MKKPGWIAGSAVVAVLVLALAVPALMDWNRFKAPLLEALGAATGRKVSISGPIGVRLLPSPGATVRGLAIANPSGVEGNLAVVERARVNVAWLPLLVGKVRVTSLDLEKPEIHLMQLTGGGNNWSFGATEATPPSQSAPAQGQRPPRIEPPAAAPADESLPVDEIVISNGAVTYGDESGQKLALTDLVGRVLLGGRSGPFKASGAVKVEGTLLSFDAAMERLAPDRAAPITLALGVPGDEAKFTFQGLASHLSGGETVRGRLALSAPDPRRTLSRLGVSAPVPAGELAADAELAVSAQELSVANLTVSLGDQRVTGAINAAFGDQPQVDIRLGAAALTLDKWQAPATTAEPPSTASPPPATSDVPGGGQAPQAVAGGFALPKSLFATANLSVDALSWHGQVVREIRFEAALNDGELVLRTLSAQLPGNSALSADGALVSRDGRPSFDGTLRLRSDNLRSVLAWAGVEPQGIAQSRLRTLDLTAPLHLAWPDLRLADFRLGLDNSQARGTLSARLSGRPAFGLAASVDSVNLDAYLPSPKGTAAPEAGASAGKSAPREQEAAPPSGKAAGGGLDFDADLALKVGSLTVQGMALTDVAANALLQAGVLEVKRLSAELAGTQIGLHGRIRNLGQDTQNVEQVSFEVDSPQPARLLRAFGSEGTKSLPPVRVSGQVSGDMAGKVFDIAGLSLTSGATSVAGQGRVDLSGAKPLVTAELAAKELALDPFLGNNRTGLLLPGGPRVPPFAMPPGANAIPAAAGQVGVGNSPFSRDPIDLSALNALNAHVGLKAEAVTAKGWRLEQVLARLTVQDGAASLDSLTGQLLGGQMNANAKVVSAPHPGLSWTLAVAGADLSKASLELGGGMKLTQGVLDLQGQFATSGRSTQDMAAGLNGDGKLTVKNGVLDGFDLPAVNQRLTNIENLGSLLGVVQAGMAGGKTPFSQLAGTFRAEKGVVFSNDLKLDAQGGGASAQTSVDLPRWSTNTAISIHLANAAQTPLGIRLEGPLENPRKIIDVNALQQHLVSRGLGRAFKGLQSGEQPQAGEDQPREKNTGKNILKNLLKGMGGQ